MGGAVFLPYYLTWEKTMVVVMKIMLTSFKRSCACTDALSAPDPVACQRQPMPQLETLGLSQASLNWFLVRSLLLFLGAGAHKILFVSSKSLVPQLYLSPPGLQIQILWGLSVPLPDPQVGKSVVGPRTFLTVWAFIWYNCSAVYGLSAQWLYGGVNGNLL